MAAELPTELPPAFNVLGTPVHKVTYASALDRCLALARRGRPAAVSACNTHLVTLARMDKKFHEVMGDFDLVVPDGYPLVWCMNTMGAGLKDRVYGPYLMKYILERTPRPWKHFFFGGTEDCLSRLRDAAKKMQPDIEIAGWLSPPFGTWSQEDEHRFAATITASGADFIWVALGGGRQETWIRDHLRHFRSGVFFAVGDAFELLAGGRPFAPEWMQHRGLTWLYRLAQEPRRLFGRYLQFNSRFLFYRFRDILLGTPKNLGTQTSPQWPRIAFLGSRGVPARYSGFEVVVEELGSRLAGRGYPVTVYNRYPRQQSRAKFFKGMRIVVLPTIPTKSLDTIVHTALSALHAALRRYELIYICGVGNAILGSFLRAVGMRVVINVDGADFRRSKWGSFARMWLRTSERIAGRVSDRVIADNREIVSRYEREHGERPLYVSYGTTIRRERVSVGELAHWKLEPQGYILFVSRLTPENRADLLLEAFSRYQGPLKLVICGTSDYEHAHSRELRRLADERVVFTGGRFGDAYVELSQGARFFVMPATIEATRLVLLDQMGMGSTILYNDCPATREVVGDAGEPFSGEDLAAALSEKLHTLGEDPERCRTLGQLALQRAETVFDWEVVTDRYEEIFRELCPEPQLRSPVSSGA